MNNNRFERQEMSWPSEPQFVLTLDFECDYGTAISENRYEALEYTSELTEILERLEVPLSCFIQTETFREKPEAVETLRQADIDVKFHPHSHSHRPRSDISVPEEIAISTEKFRDFFGQKPVGYRFPNGNVRKRDYKHLAQNGYQFDASIFPSWRPSHFNNTGAATVPEFIPKYDLYELPFTVYTETVRIPTALSYCRLLGKPFTQALLKRSPETVVFNIHMHDFVNTSSFDLLPPFYRAIYARNPSGFAILEQVLSSFRSKPHTFRTMNQIYADLRGQ